MRELMVCKTLSLVCLLEGFLLMNVSISGLEVYFFTMFLGCLVGADLSFRLREKGALRYLPMCLPGVAMLTTGELVFRAYVLLVVVCMLFVAFHNQYEVEYLTYRRTYVTMLVVALSLTAIFMVTVSFYQQCDRWEPYVAIMLCVAFGSFVLRQSRLGVFSDRREKVLHVTLLLSVVGVATLIAVLLQVLGMFEFRQVMEIVFLPIAFIIKWLSQMFIKAAAPIGENEKESAEIAKKTMKFMQKHKVGKSRFEEKVREANVPEIDNHYLVLIGIALAVIVILLIMILAWYLLKESYVFNEGTSGGRSFTFEALEKGPRRARRGRGNRDKIRNYYCQYLKKGRQNGYTFWDSDTSYDINERMELLGQNPEKGSEFRELYIRARYNEGYEPTAEEVRNMKELARDLKSEMCK